MAIKYIRKEVDRPRGISSRTERWSTKQKMEAVSMYRLTGNLALVEKTLGISYHTLKGWKASQWWDEYTEELRQAANSELNGKLGKIVDKSLKVVEDRLENGDFHYDQKTGNIFRKPIGAHVANRIANDAIDRTMLLEKMRREEKHQHTEELMKEKLFRLHEEFAKFSKAKEVIQEAETLDVKMPN